MRFCKSLGKPSIGVGSAKCRVACNVKQSKAMRYLYKENETQEPNSPEFIKCKNCTCVFETQGDAIPRKCPQCRSKNKSDHNGTIEWWTCESIDVALANLYAAKE